MSDPVRIIVGDCLEAMRGMDAESVDAIVTDPPYGLSFMGKHWDHGVPGVEFWVEALRVAKPGTHLLAFGGTRTYHRLACAIEDAGWDVRDCIMYVYGSGFPKSMDVSKAIDKAAGASGSRGQMKRGGERLARLENGARDGEGRWGDESGRDPYTYLAATDLARQWSGWGTALKPAFEPIIVARKPLIGTVAENVTTHGTGAMNVDGCRVGKGGGTRKAGPPSYKPGVSLHGSLDGSLNGGGCEPINAGRWPANLIHDGSDEVLGLFPSDGEQSAARFFYCAKASKADRGDGNTHATVKPTTLMRYLCRLVTPPGGVVLDPFAGSGSTGKGAVLEGFNFIGIELDAEYAEIARARIGNATSADKGLFA